jgi:hypothetical protein
MCDYFHKFARATSNCVGSPWMLAAAVAVVVGWARADSDSAGLLPDRRLHMSVWAHPARWKL